MAPRRADREEPELLRAALDGGEPNEISHEELIGFENDDPTRRLDFSAYLHTPDPC